MNNLPIEIQDKIWCHYWQFEYKNVLEDIVKPFKIEKKCLDFFNKYIGVLNHKYKMNYKHYFLDLNKDIYNIINNKGLMIIANNSQLLLRYITKEYIYNIFRTVPIGYKYVAALCVIISGQQRFNILNMFSNINNYIN
tara:strand:+ start:2355 stop:2768 length:414 start_codon:yes stop_codon:yes gene_type:complete